MLGKVITEISNRGQEARKRPDPASLVRVRSCLGCSRSTRS